LRKVLLGAGLFALLGVAAALGAFGDLDAPDADQQEKTATACLHGAGLEVKSSIPPYSRIRVTPEYVLDVDTKEGDHDHLAFVLLFDTPNDSERYVEDLKLDWEDEPPTDEVTIEQRGPAAVRLFADRPQAAEIRACVDKAGKPPPEKK
jgi:hypothetical protein